MQCHFKDEDIQNFWEHKQVKFQAYLISTSPLVLSQLWYIVKQLTLRLECCSDGDMQMKRKQFSKWQNARIKQYQYYLDNVYKNVYKGNLASNGYTRKHPFS